MHQMQQIIRLIIIKISSREGMQWQDNIQLYHLQQNISNSVGSPWTWDSKTQSKLLLPILQEIHWMEVNI